MDPICFYHSADLDGMCSGAIIYHRYNRNIDMIPINYHDPFPMDLVVGREVVMVDFSVDISLMQEIREKASSFIWIDHHETAIDAAKEAGFITTGLQKVGEAGCELAWRFFHNPFIPMWVTLLGRFDVWDKKHDMFTWEDHILPFQYGVRNQDVDPRSGFWDQFIVHDSVHRQLSETWLIDMLMIEGRALLKYQRGRDARYVSARAFDAVLNTPDGKHYNTVACNVALASSDFFCSIAPKTLAQYDLMLMFCMTKKRTWSISLRSDKPEVHCGQIAQCFGGGGHAGAAGFECEDLSFFSIVKSGTASGRFQCSEPNEANNKLR